MKSKPVRASKRKTLKRPRQPATKRTTKAKRGLGENIKEARQRKGITQLALAHAIGYLGEDAGAYISRVESNSQAPRLDTLSRIADALGVAVCSLLPEREK